MPQFTVNLVTLEALQRNLVGIYVELNSGSSGGIAPSSYGSNGADFNIATGNGYTAGDSISGGALNGADEPFAGFLNAWQGSLSDIGEGLESVISALGSAIKEYASCEVTNTQAAADAHYVPAGGMR